MIVPINPNTGNAWKNNYTDTLCGQRNETGKLFFEYFQEKAYTVNETFLLFNENFQEHPILTYASGCFGFQFEFNYNVSVNLSQLYRHGHGHTLDLNPEMEYIVVLTDPKLQIFVYATDMFPRTLFKLKPKGGIKLQYLKVHCHQKLQLYT